MGLSATPDVDIAEAADEVRVWVDLPGCEEESIDLAGDKWTLHVAAERAATYWQGEVTRRERGRRAERSISLPARSGVDEAEATYDDGVLLVRLPKHESGRTRPIDLR